MQITEYEAAYNRFRDHLSAGGVSRWDCPLRTGQMKSWPHTPLLL